MGGIVGGNIYKTSGTIPQLRELEPLETRVMRHSYHLLDNNNPEGNYFLLQGRKNSFFFEHNDGNGVLYPPFEDQFLEPMEELCKDLLNDYCSSLSIFGYEDSALEDFSFKYESVDISARILQTPYPAEMYEMRLTKFWRVGFTYRELEKNDISDIIGLNSRWVEEKKKIIRKNFDTLSFDAGNVEEVQRKIDDLKLLKSELQGIEAALDKGRKYYAELFSQPITQFYGAFREGRLVAYLQTEGNNSFQSFTTRASERMNSYSPQEFLDLQVALDFVRKGVRQFERGVYNKRILIDGLMRYKEKFGPLRIVKEYDYEDIELT